MSEFRKGDAVEWNSSGGKSRGKVVEKVTREVHVKGHDAKASANEPQYRVKSDKSGKEAVHKPSALRRVSGGAKAKPSAAQEKKPARAAGRKSAR